MPYKNQSISCFLHKNIPLTTIPFTFFGYSSEYASANADPQLPPNTNHLFILRKRRSFSISSIKCCVELFFIFPGGIDLPLPL